MQQNDFCASSIFETCLYVDWWATSLDRAVKRLHSQAPGLAMKLPIVVMYPDATQADTSCEFKFNLPVGSGGQSIKWLALTAAQRFRAVRVVSPEFHNAT